MEEEKEKECCENDSLAEPTENQQKSIDKTEYYGGYFTTQYEVLERMLSYLNINDLITASNVHSSWKHISERLLKKRQNLRWHIRKKDNIAGHSFKKNEIDFQSEFILGFQLRRSKDRLLTELMEDDSYISSNFGKDVRLTKGRNIPGLWNSNMILIRTCNLEAPYYTENKELKYFDEVEVGIFFPKIEGLEIITIPVGIDDRSFEFNSPSLKGVLTFHTEGLFEVIETAFNKLLDCSTPIALAGGVFGHVKTYCQEVNSLKPNPDIVNVYFCGENVSCHSAVLNTRKTNEVEEFMIDMKEKIGPFNAKKQRRIAIVIRCVGRTNYKHEKALFKQYFPDVPAFTVLSAGECGYHSITESEDISKEKRSRKYVAITHCYSVVFFFVTVNLPT